MDKVVAPRCSVARIVITEDDDDLDLDALLLGDAKSGGPPYPPSPPSPQHTVLSSPPPSPLKLTSTISAVEEDEGNNGGDPLEWVLPPPAAPGDYLQNSLHKVPSKSILKKKSSYADFPTNASSSTLGSRSMGTKPSFLGLSSSSIRSHTSGRVQQPPGSPTVGMDLDDSSLSQQLGPQKKSFIEGIPALPHLGKESAANADVAAGSSLDVSSGLLSVSSAPPMKRNVSFNSVAIREYDRTIGDNPSCRSGPPLSLDWSYSKKYEKSIDDFEDQRSKERVSHLRKLHMNKYKRRNMLSFHWGHSEDEMKEARQTTKKIQQQRSVTKALLPLHRAQEGWMTLRKMVSKKNVTGLTEDELSELSGSSTTKDSSTLMYAGQSFRVDCQGLPSSTHTT